MSTLTRVTKPQELTLSTAEIELLMAYRSMNDKMQYASLMTVKAWVDIGPRRAAPSLRLIAGSAA